MSKGKSLLIITVIALVIIGLSYAMTMVQSFIGESLTNASLIELIPEECKVLKTSSGVTAAVEFNRDKFGNIVDRTHIQLIMGSIYPGANATFSIAAKNISSIPLSVDYYTLEIDSGNSTLDELISFSGRVNIYRGDSEYYAVLGTFKNVRFSELADVLTSIMKYRKIDVTEKMVLELNQQFDDNWERFEQRGGLSYVLISVFIQYFPSDMDDDFVEEK
jgi:hypothetical protein